jgi:hypothetical protein
MDATVYQDMDFAYLVARCVRLEYYGNGEHRDTCTQLRTTRRIYVPVSVLRRGVCSLEQRQAYSKSKQQPDRDARCEMRDALGVAMEGAKRR